MTKLLSTLCLPVGIERSDARNLSSGTAEEVDESQGQCDGLEHTHHQGKLLASDLEEINEHTTSHYPNTCTVKNVIVPLYVQYSDDYIMD